MGSNDYISSPLQIIQGDFYGLPHEVAYMNLEIEALRMKRAGIALHIADAMEQSSETWHDNAPADALFGEMKIVDQREARLIVAQRRLHLVHYPTPEHLPVTIGSRVTCEIGSDKFDMDIVGNLPITMEPDGDTEIGSIAAPMPQALLGHEAGEKVEARVGESIIKIGIIAVDQVAQKEHRDIQKRDS